MVSDFTSEKAKIIDEKLGVTGVCGCDIIEDVPMDAEGTEVHSHQ